MRFIATGDWHLRSDIPRSVKVDSVEKWIDLQMENLRQIKKIAKENEISSIVVAGDVFNTYCESQSLINKTIQELRSWAGSGEYEDISVYGIAGNHDLPYHSFVNIDNSSFGILKNAGCLHLMDYENFGSFKGNDITGCSFAEEKTKDTLIPYSIGVLHRLVAPANTFPADVKIDEPETMFAEFPNYQNMIVGDYHHSFLAKKGTGKKQRKLLVPGCIGRQAIDMQDYECKIWICELLESGEMKAEPKTLKNLWELERVEETAKNSSLLDAFVSLSANSFDYKDRILAEENLKPLTATQRTLLHEITNRRMAQ